MSYFLPPFSKSQKSLLFFPPNIVLWRRHFPNYLQRYTTHCKHKLIQVVAMPKIELKTFKRQEIIVGMRERKKEEINTFKNIKWHFRGKKRSLGEKVCGLPHYASMPSCERGKEGQTINLTACMLWIKTQSTAPKYSIKKAS